MPSSIVFAVGSWQERANTAIIVPVIDGVRLTDRIHAFEREAGIIVGDEPYAGLVPTLLAVSAARHYLPEANAGKVPLLGCECGELGCWPLLARVASSAREVTWSAFEQPHRPANDYSAFGPFAFSRSDYDAALGEIAEPWATGLTPRATPHGTGSAPGA